MITYQKLKKCPNLIAGLLSVAISVVPLYWMLDFQKPYAATGFEQIGEAYPGKVLTIQGKGTRYRVCPVQVQVTLMDANLQLVKVIDQRYDAAGALGPVEYTSRLDVPYWFEPGPALYKLVLSYQCNPWQRFVQPLVVTYTAPIKIDMLVK